MLSLPILAALGLAASLQGARAQITSNATCLNTYRGLYNSKGQSPCLIAAYLGGACNGGQYDVSSLNPDEHYIGPSSLIANECLCSTVYYSLIGGCSACQNESMISWSSWATDCPTVYVQTFPVDIPSDTAVPGWAYGAIPTNGTFDVNAALASTAQESTATFIQSTASGTRTTGTRTSTPSSGSSSQSNNGNDDDNGPNVGAIAGGVVGGVVGVALLALLGFFLYRRSQRKKNALGTGIQPNLTGDAFTPHKTEYAPVPYTPGAYGANGAAPGGYSDTAGMVGGMGGMGVEGMPSPPMQQKYYDPSDPSTFPTSPAPVSVNTQNTGTSNSYAPSFPQAQPQPASNQGMYRGVAEI